MKILFHEDNLSAFLQSGTFGLEKESLRVDACGAPARTPHPFVTDPEIVRDFSENQMEFVTPVADSIDGAIAALTALHQRASRLLLHRDTGMEFLWPFSNPPRVTEDQDIPIAYGGQGGKGKYRRYLAEKYGKRIMLLSGIHFNFAFPEEALRRAHRANPGPFAGDFRAYRDALYLALARNLTRYSWLTVLLTAASPLWDASLWAESAHLPELRAYGSVRCGNRGYWNSFLPVLSYDSLTSYANSIRRYLDNGMLYSPAELYQPVRLKPRGANTVKNLIAGGVDHIELRMIDLNPFSPVGVWKEDLQFLHLLMLCCVAWDSPPLFPGEQVAAVSNMQQAARFDPARVAIQTPEGVRPILDASLAILDSMEDFFRMHRAPGEVLWVIGRQRDKLLHPGGRYAARVWDRFAGDYLSGGLALARRYAAQLTGDETAAL